MELIILLPVKRAMHATSSRKADAAMHEICGVRRIVPVRRIGHEKRQKGIVEGRYIGRPGARYGAFSGAHYSRLPGACPETARGRTS
ncbi:MAG: hypothetical protein U0938_11040 [Thiobacillus sp.]|nr:hypothetical protein [Thiobacillus sp.]